MRCFLLCHNLKQIRICCIFYAVIKYVLWWVSSPLPFFFLGHIFSLRVGLSVLIKMEYWKMQFEQMDLSYQATVSFPGNGKRIGAGAKWILFLFLF